MLDLNNATQAVSSNGIERHTGRLQVSRKQANGTLVTVMLPDDWAALVARVAALEAAAGATLNSLEDLTYGG